MARQGITVKSAKLVKGIAEGKTKQQAALDAGYGTNPESASAIATETLKNPKVQEALQEELARQGITMYDIVAPVTKALKAKKIIFHGKDSGEAFVGEVEDVELQLKGHDRAMKIIGASAKEGGDNIYIFNKGDLVGSKYVKD